MHAVIPAIITNMIIIPDIIPIIPSLLRAMLGTEW